MFNPSKRLTAEQALAHAYVEQFHNPADEPESPSIIHITIDDNTKYTAEDYRDRPVLPSNPSHVVSPPTVRPALLSLTTTARLAHTHTHRVGSTRRSGRTRRNG